MSHHLPELPSETWATIFEFLIQETVPKYILFISSRPHTFRWLNNGRGRSNSYTWTQVTHVCQYWRDCALAAPILWTYIDTYNVEVADIFLERSQSSPIKVSLRKRCPDLFVERLLPHTERLEWLSLDEPNCKSYAMKRLLSAPTPMLKTFRYTGPSMGVFRQPSFDMSRVQSLVLKGGDFPGWDWHRLDLKSDINMEEILRLLMANPQLRHGKIEANNPTLPRWEGGPQIVELKCLHRLNVICPDENQRQWTEDFTARLSVPGRISTPWSRVLSRP
jgi:hypothetical protein